MDFYVILFKNFISDEWIHGTKNKNLKKKNIISSYEKAKNTPENSGVFLEKKAFYSSILNL
jgi:hypothetical protein